MMLPILISVSVAPVSYFFCASAPLAEAASTANAAADAMAILFPNTGITVSLCSDDLDDVHLFRLSWSKALCEPGRLSTILPGSSQEKALRASGEGLLL